VEIYVQVYKYKSERERDVTKIKKAECREDIIQKKKNIKNKNFL